MLFEELEIEMVFDGEVEELIGCWKVNLVDEVLSALWAEELCWGVHHSCNIKVSSDHKAKLSSTLQASCNLLKHKVSVGTPVQYAVGKYDVVLISRNILSSSLYISDVAEGIFALGYKQALSVWINANNL